MGEHAQSLHPGAGLAPVGGGEPNVGEVGPKCSDFSPAPQNRPPGDRKGGASLTEALPPDLQGVLCGKQGLGEADEDLGPERAAVISPCVPPLCPPKQRARADTAHLPILYSSAL